MDIIDRNVYPPDHKTVIKLRFMQNTKRRQRANRCIESTTANSCCPREPIPKALSLR
ncbi:uncharacterized protein LOC100867320 isoform X8 [Apis florea]|uniref:uncharacterized protein LOC100867320 isoform X8 n=1 Tax=Apis florea TaxID=7463 RepID=UPI0012FEB91C|nr:uncharacterized protein LOC100867320 isoform X8 [Apis florea]